MQIYKLKSCTGNKCYVKSASEISPSEKHLYEPLFSNASARPRPRSSSPKSPRSASTPKPRVASAVTEAADPKTISFEKCKSYNSGKDENVEGLHFKNFELTLTDHSLDAEKVVMLFYSPMCGYCVMFHPEFQKFINTVNKPVSRVKAAVFNCTTNENATLRGELAQHIQGLQGVPAVYTFNKVAGGKWVMDKNNKFTEDRTLGKLLEYSGLKIKSA